MSAFAGILRLDRGQAETELADRMAGVGAEDGGYRSPDGRLALSARPNASRAGEPFSNETHDVWLVLDGAVYNHRALRHGLELDGHRFRTQCDAEVALHGYEQWGTDFLEHLAGDFALALWDDRRDRLVLARDRLGRRPLYFAEQGARLAFCSSLRALAEALPGPHRLDPAALADYLAGGHVLPPRTLVAGVRKLAPGEMLVADRDGPPYRARWAKAPVDERRAASVRAQGADRHAGNLRTLIECSVADRLMGEVPVGALLGPGLDGGVAAGIMARLTGRTVTGVTVLDAANPNGPAAQDARLLARAAAAELHEVAVAEDEAAAALPTLSANLPEPVAEPGLLLWWWAGKGCAEAGLAAVLAGAGADEVLAALPAYRSGLGLGARLRRWLTGRAAPPPDAGWRDLLGPVARLDAADGHDIGRATGLPGWLAADAQAAAGWLDLTGRVAETVCPLADALGGVAARLPYLDDALVAYATAVPGRYRSPAGAPKQLFRRAVADLVPRELLARAATPASLPLDRWLAGGPLAAAVEAMVASSGLFRHDVLAADQARRLLAQHRQYGGQGGGRGKALFGLLVLAEFYDRLGLDGVAPREAPGWSDAGLPLYSRS